MTAAERFALAGALALLLLQAATPLHAALEYQRALAGTQPWRLFGAHVVHLNWPHVLVNAAAWWVVARLYAPELGVRRQALVIGVSAPVIGVLLALLHPAIGGYRGFSGVLHALFFAGTLTWLLPALRERATRTVRALWLPVLLLAGGALKVAFEQPGGSTTPHAEWLGANVVPQAHLFGALAGGALGLAFGLRDARRG